MKDLEGRYYKEKYLKDSFTSELRDLEKEKLLLEQALDRINAHIKTKEYEIQMQDKIIKKIEKDMEVQ